MKKTLGLMGILAANMAGAATFDHPEAPAVFHSHAIQTSLTQLSKYIEDLNTFVQAKPPKTVPPGALDPAIVKKIAEDKRLDALSPVTHVAVTDVKIGKFDDTEGNRWADFTGVVELELQSRKIFHCEIEGTSHQIGKTLRWAVRQLKDHCTLK